MSLGVRYPFGFICLNVETVYVAKNNQVERLARLNIVASFVSCTLICAATRYA